MKKKTKGILLYEDKDVRWDVASDKIVEGRLVQFGGAQL